MMNRVMKPSLALVGAAALIGALGCTEEPGLFLGGPPGPATALALSASRFTVIVGDSVQLGARAEDAVGNATADQPTFSSCDPGVVAEGSAITDPGYVKSAWIRAAGLGVSCMVVQAAGLTDTVRITTGPAGVTVAGPDTIGSGNSGEFVAEPVDRGGNPLTGSTAYAWSSSNLARMAVVPETGIASGRGTGTVNIQVLAPGGANARKAVVVVPGVFGGTLSATSAAPGALITATKAADAPAFDADQLVRLGSISAYVDAIRPGAVTFAVPAINSTAASTLTLSNIGPAQLAQTTSFTPTLALDDTYGDAARNPFTSPDVDAAKSANNNVYMVSAGACVDLGNGWGEGADCDNFLTISAGASPRTVTVTLNWVNNTGATGDLDILWIDENFTSFVGNFDGYSSAKPEVSSVTIPENTTWRLWIENYAQNAAHWVNIKVTIE